MLVDKVVIGYFFYDIEFLIELIKLVLIIWEGCVLILVFYVFMFVIFGKDICICEEICEFSVSFI